MLKIGIDVVEVRRIKKAIEKHPAFQKRFYTEKEQVYARSKKIHAYESFAGTFAAKEAFYKALGTGFIEGRWHEVEVVRDELGAPSIVLYGRMREVVQEKGIDEIAVSITHTKELAWAEVILNQKA